MAEHTKRHKSNVCKFVHYFDISKKHVQAINMDKPPKQEADEQVDDRLVEAVKEATKCE